MDNAGNCRAPDAAPRESLYVLSLWFDPVTKEFSLDGLLSVPFPVALGMLAYAEIMVRREDMKLQLAHAAQNAPRIVGPGRGL